MLTPVIQGTQEIEFGRITVPGQPRQLVHETTSPQKKTTPKPKTECIRKHKIEELQSKTAGPKVRPYL
jgi:hypothetical protein